MNHNKGFSLIELMVTIAIVAILAAVVTPSMLGWRDRTKLRGAIQNLRADFEAAKLRAIKHNTDVVVTFPDNTSYQVFIDTDRSGTRGPGEEILFERALIPGVTITGNTFTGNDMSFNSRGTPDGPNSAGTITMTSVGGNGYQVIVNPFGRIRTQRL